MKGLRKYLTPFAPDQSGAVSVLYELGGMLVICDAGGCTGNVCGFDAAVIGTPVPAVIGTDYRALERMLSKKTDLSVLTVNTDGMELYDKGEEKAYLALFEKFSDKNEESEDMNDKDRPHIGIIGMTPQDVSDLKAADKIRKVYADQGMRAIFSGSEECGRISGSIKSSAVSAKEVRNTI